MIVDNGGSVANSAPENNIDLISPLLRYIYFSHNLLNGYPVDLVFSFT